MTHFAQTLLASSVFALASTVAAAACDIESGNVRVLSNDFAAMKAIAGQLEACASDKVTVEINQTVEHKDIQVAALTTDPAQYSLVVISNASISPLLTADLIRPLDDLIAKYGAALRPNQLIKVGG